MKFRNVWLYLFISLVNSDAYRSLFTFYYSKNLPSNLLDEASDSASGRRNKKFGVSTQSKYSSWENVIWTVPFSIELFLIISTWSFPPCVCIFLKPTMMDQKAVGERDGSLHDADLSKSARRRRTDGVSSTWVRK